MSRRIVAASVLLFAGVMPMRAQSTDLPPAMRLLAHVTQRYAQADNYYIKAIEKETDFGEFGGSWTKKILIASAAGRRFHFEVQTGNGSATEIADGSTVWLRHAGEHSYTSLPESDEGLKDTIRAAIQDEQIQPARRLRARLVNLGRGAAEADFLPNAFLSVGNQLVRSRVILIRTSGLNTSVEMTVWIDEDGERILKIVERRQAPAGSGSGPREIETETTLETLFDPPDCLFTVMTADMVPNSDERREHPIVNLQSLVGKKLPELHFKSADGAVVPLSSFAGRPLLIDFWATWCAPSVAALPELAEIYEESRGIGLTFVAIDQDEEPGKASAFLRKKGYTWPDVSDPEAEVHKQLGYEGMPHVILVDATGTVVYDGSGENASELRSRIASLGPEFRPLAPEPGPCATAK